MLKKYFQKRKKLKKQQATLALKLNNIDKFPLGDEWKASPKKQEELSELTEWLAWLVLTYDFKVDRGWGDTGLPKDAQLSHSSDNHNIYLECEVDVTGQNYDRVGKITVHFDWHYFGIHDEEKDIYVGELEKQRSSTLNAAKKLIPTVLKDTKIVY